MHEHYYTSAAADRDNVWEQMTLIEQTPDNILLEDVSHYLTVISTLALARTPILEMLKKTSNSSDSQFHRAVNESIVILYW